MRIETRYYIGSMDITWEFVPEDEDSYYLDQWTAWRWMESRRDAPEWVPAVKQVHVIVESDDKVFVWNKDNKIVETQENNN